jgi:pyruvate dehydrogenase E2 component (dihydrolipoamide acetyltransferase)
MEKGNLAKWLKKEGEPVKAGDVIAEIETDKATMEVEAADEGVLAKILIPAGTADVPVNKPIAVLAGEGEDVRAAAATTQAGPAPRAAEPQVKIAAPPEKPSLSGEGLTTPERKPAAAPPPRAPTEFAPRTNGGGRTFASPLARRLAKEAGIEIARIEGSGPHGRVIARDVEAAKSGVALKPAAPVPAAQPGVARPSVAPPVIEAPSDEQIRALFEPNSYEVVAHDNMRRIIARRLTEAKLTIPHFYLTIDCTIDALLAAREQINAAAPKDKDNKPAYKLSLNDFVIKALALALQKAPDANVTWTEGGMLKHRHSDVGVAVAIKGGLITPIVRKAELKRLSIISNEMKDLAARARARRLKPEEYQGGSAAVSNLGMYGVKEFAAVINPPHATILAVGAGEERAVVRKGGVAVATVMTVTLSTDHRAVDGAVGAELMAAFKSLIENPVMMVV